MTLQGSDAHPRILHEHELVICTRSRPNDLRNALEAIANQVAMPARVLVVDSSPTDASFVEVRKMQLHAPFKLEHVFAEPGLTHQRNVALSLILPTTRFVHFIDDDAAPDSNYLVEMDAAFGRHPDAVGCCGAITTLPQFRSNTLYRALGLEGPQGSLLRSGFNFQNFAGGQDRRTGWLTGCAMSYRLDRIAGMLFDERRGGGGTGEDVDFSARAATRGALYWIPSAKIAHYSSPQNRPAVELWYRRLVLHRWLLARDGVPPVKRHSVLLSTAVIIGMYLLKALRTGSLGTARAGIQMALGLFDIIRGGEWRSPRPDWPSS